MKRTVVITGANSGIGFEASRYFANTGDRLVMACRNLEKAEKARGELLQEAPEADITLLQLDVSDLGSVHAFAREFQQQFGVLDILINNAGIVAIPLSRNDAGHEMQLATNYLGAFALTGLLLPLFRAEAPTRIVNVGSLAHRLGKLNPDDLNWDQTPYDQWKAYANSKVAMMSYTLELNRRLQRSGSKTIALSAHPGFANTNIHQNSPALSKSDSGKNAFSRWYKGKMERLIPTADQAARPIILAADNDNVSGGDYYGPGGFLEIGGKPDRARINPKARDMELAKRLWDVSEQMTGVHYLSGD